MSPASRPTSTTCGAELGALREDSEQQQSLLSLFTAARPETLRAGRPGRVSEVVELGLVFMSDPDD